MGYRWIIPWFCSTCALIAGCAVGQAPVSDRSSKSAGEATVTSKTAITKEVPATAKRNVHIVRSGDTLYSIAWDAGVDFRSLAQWNQIQAPFIIRPGQRLTLIPSQGQYSKNTAAPTKPKPTSKPKPVSEPKRDPSEKWIWPVEGQVISRFSVGKGNKGIDIAGQSGAGVRAAASGRVVYAGSGLRGYGKLIIVKHDNVYLSAYAHNSKLLVKDGTTVSQGQQIALMGKTGTDRVKLHFEIRQKGKPINPLKYLPKRP